MAAPLQDPDDPPPLQPWGTDPIRGGLRNTRRIALLVGATAAIGVAVAWWVTPPNPRPAESIPPHRSAIPTHPFGFVDTPLSVSLIGPKVSVTGWALSAKGIDRVEVRLDDEVHVARHGLPRPDVATVHGLVTEADRSGFQFDGDFTGRLVGRHTLSVVAIDRSGLSHEMPARPCLHPSRSRDGNPCSIPGLRWRLRRSICCRRHRA